MILQESEGNEVCLNGPELRDDDFYSREWRSFFWRQGEPAILRWLKEPGCWRPVELLHDDA
jgi:hypothetical protein